MGLWQTGKSCLERYRVQAKRGSWGDSGMNLPPSIPGSEPLSAHFCWNHPQAAAGQLTPWRRARRHRQGRGCLCVRGQGGSKNWPSWGPSPAGKAHEPHPDDTLGGAAAHAHSRGMRPRISKAAASVGSARRPLTWELSVWGGACLSLLRAGGAATVPMGGRLHGVTQAWRPRPSMLAFLLGGPPGTGRAVLALLAWPSG